MRQVCDGDPVPPRQLNPAISKDLETICLKCLEKDPGRRYASAAEFADDLQRYLQYEPIVARPLSWLGRTARWCRRRPTVAALTGALLVAVVAGTTGTGVALWRSERERARAVQNLAAAELERANARRTVDTMFVKVAEQDLFDTPGTQPVRRELLESALQFYESFALQHHDDPTAQADMISILTRVARIHLLLENLDPAREFLRLAIGRLEQHVPERETADQRIQYARLFEQLGQAETLANNQDAAEQAARRAIEILAPDPAAMTKDKKTRAMLARSYATLAIAHNDAGCFQDSLEAFHRAIELADGGNPSFLGWALSEAAAVYLNDDGVDEAELLLQRALSTLEEIPVRSLPATYKILLARDTLARLYLRSGKPDEVLRLCHLTVPYWQMLELAHPSVPVYARGYCQALGRSAQARLQLGDEVGARADLDIALQLRDRIAIDDTQWNACDVLDFAEGLGTLGTVKRRLRQLGEAKSLFEQGLELLDEHESWFPKNGRFSHVYSTHLVNLADVETRLGIWDAARKHLVEAIEMRERLYRERPSNAIVAYKLAISYRGMGLLYRATGEADQMVRYWEKAIAVGESSLATGKTAPSTLSELAATHTSLGIFFKQCKDFQQAARHYESAIELAEKLVVAYPKVDAYQHELAKSSCAARSIFLQHSDAAKAEQVVQRALELWQDLADRNPEDATYKRALVHAWASLAAVRYSRRNLAGAIEACEHCCRVGEPLVEGSSPPSAECATLAGNYLQFANILQEAGEPAAARADCYRRAVELAGLAYQGDQRKYAQRFRDASLAAATHAESEGQWQDAVEHWKQLGQFETGEKAGLVDMHLALALAHTGDSDEARHRCAKLLEQEPSHAESYFVAVRLYLATATQADDAADATSYLKDAIRMLQLSARHGFFEAEETRQLLDDSEFDPLRDNTDFKAFLDSLPKT